MFPSDVPPTQPSPPAPAQPPAPPIPCVPIDGSGLRQIIKGFHLRTSAPVQQADIAQALRFAVPMTEQLENVQRITKGLERLVEFTSFEVGIADMVELHGDLNWMG